MIEWNSDFSKYQNYQAIHCRLIKNDCNNLLGIVQATTRHMTLVAYNHLEERQDIKVYLWF